jgi:hypothetical protein
LRGKIDVVRRLRNECAHEVGPLDLDDPRFRDRLALLKGPDLKPDPPVATGQEEMADANREIMVRRIAFALRVVKIVGHLDALASRAREGVDIRKIVLQAEEERAAQQGDEADER